MSRKARTTPDSSHRKRYFIWSMAGILIILGGTGIALFFFLSSVNHPQSASIPRIQPPRTAPDLLVQQYCADLISSNYASAYDLLSSSSRQQMDPLGGATFLARQLQQMADKYGAITTCQVMNVTKNANGPGGNQTTVTVQIQRQHFQENQTETDQFILIFQPNGWAINTWTSDIATK